MKLILILACAFASAYLNLGETSFADEADSISGGNCFEVNLDTPGGTMEAVVARAPKIMQSGGVCTYHAAAEMYDAWREKYHASPVTRSTSPLAVAMQNSLHDNLHNFETGGEAADNLYDLLKYGGCPRKSYNPSTGQDMDEYYYNEVSERFDSLQGEYTAHVMDWTKPPPTLWNLTSQIRQLVIDFAAKYPGYPLRTNISFPNLETYFLMGNFVSFMNEMIPMDCSAAERLWPGRAYTIANFFDTNGDSVSKLAAINAELDLGAANAQPIGIAYCANVLDDGRAYQPRAFTSPNCGRHESLIIGRRKNPQTGTCQFLVRNSWGRHSPYAKEWQKLVPLDHVWIDADTLVSSIHEVTILK